MWDWVCWSRRRKPNESVGGQGWIIRNRQLGVKKGVPDLFYPVPSGGYHGLFIEMKAAGGRVSPDQERWIQCLNGFGYKAVVCYGWEEAKDAILGYLQPLHGGHVEIHESHVETEE